MSRRREVAAVERELSELAVKAPSLEAPVSALSGGNQQKVVMARAMLSEPAILVADEPTQGVDVGARAEIYRILREVADRGVPVVVASSDAQGARGPLRPRHRDVARPGRRDARGRRTSPRSGSSTPRSARRRTPRSRRRGAPSRLVAARALHRGRLRAGRRPRGGDDRARRLRPVAELPLPLGLQHQLGHVRVRRARLHRPRADVRAPARRHRPLGRTARRVPRRRSGRSSSSTGSRPRSGCSASR